MCESVWQFILFSVVIISFYLTHSILEMKQLDIIGLHKQWGAQNLFTILSFYHKDNERYKNLHLQGIPVKSTLKTQYTYIALDINVLALLVFSDYWNNKGIDKYSGIDKNWDIFTSKLALVLLISCKIIFQTYITL